MSLLVQEGGEMVDVEEALAAVVGAGGGIEEGADGRLLEPVQRLHPQLPTRTVQRRFLDAHLQTLD